MEAARGFARGLPLSPFPLQQATDDDRMKQKNIIAGVVLLVAALAYGWLALQLPDRALTGALGPGFFPTIIAGLLILFSATLVIQGVFITPDGDPPARGPGFARAATALFGFFIYVAVLRFTGFMIASIPFFAFMMVMFGERRIAWLVISPFVLTFALYALFEQGLYLSYPFGEDWRFSIPLPRGEWVDF